MCVCRTMNMQATNSCSTSIDRFALYSSYSWIMKCFCGSLTSFPCLVLKLQESLPRALSISAYICAVRTLSKKKSIVQIYTYMWDSSLYIIRNLSNNFCKSFQYVCYRSWENKERLGVLYNKSLFTIALERREVIIFQSEQGDKLPLMDCLVVFFAQHSFSFCSLYILSASKICRHVIFIT